MKSTIMSSLITIIIPLLDSVCDNQQDVNVQTYMVL